MFEFLSSYTQQEQWVLMLVVAVGAAMFAYVYRGYRDRKIIGSSTERRDQIIDQARREAEVIKREGLLEGKDALQKEREKVERGLTEKKVKRKQEEDRLRSKESELTRKFSDLKRGQREISEKVEAHKKEAGKLKERESSLIEKLETVARMSAEEAKAEMIQLVENEATAEAARRVRIIEDEAERDAEDKARQLLTVAIERYASEVTAERTVTMVELPSDDLKGRIIGREGRNIREFERLSGVDLVIDDTPNAVSLSCFDPVRRQVARVALSRMVKDGRIHPSRIQETLDKAQKEIDKEIRKAADKAAYSVGIHNIRSEILQVLGRLKFRTSFGQNVLAHSLEVAQIGGLIAGELKMNVATVKRCCLLHDIGKAIDHEHEGPHAIVGAELIKRYGEPAAVVTAVAGHHGDIEQSLEAIIVQISDAISAARPGVRMESAELYVKRLETIEQIATSFEGVSKAYAIQAGREVRVFVNHERLTTGKQKRLLKRSRKKSNRS
ncbi:MAG: ribonuclease Y [Candidatus Lindowbacteria bacterium]|nr:ribonuclease Y [Candidatus Lindowbacteria bacterium]